MSRYEWNSKYILKTDNAELAVSLIDTKLYLSVDHNDEDALITLLIKSATSIFEKYTGIDVLNKTYTMYLDFFPFYKRYGNRVEENFNVYTIQVKKSKLQSINSIKYYSNNVLETLDSSKYDFTQDNFYSRIYLINDNDCFPDTDDRKQAVEIEFIAGNGDTSADIPDQIKLILLRIIAYLYVNRGDCPVCDESTLTKIVPIITQYKIIEI